VWFCGWTTVLFLCMRLLWTVKCPQVFRLGLQLQFSTRMMPVYFYVDIFYCFAVNSIRYKSTWNICRCPYAANKVVAESGCFNSMWPNPCWGSYYFLLGCCIKCMRCRILLLMFLSVSLSVTQPHLALLCKNSWTDWGPIWGEDSRGPRKRGPAWTGGGGQEWGGGEFDAAFAKLLWPCCL